MARRFLVYGFLGWIIEVLWTGAGSILRGDPRLTSRTYLWMFPIYGGAVLLEPVRDRLREQPWWVRGAAYTLAIFIVEFIAGFLLELLTGVCPWDYSGTPFSVFGYIRLDYAPAWFAAGLLFEMVDDRLRGKSRKWL